MLGLVADDSSDPSIPPALPTVDASTSTGLAVHSTSTPAPKSCRPIYLCFPRCNTTRGGRPTSAIHTGTNVIEPAGTFPIGFDSCEDLVLQGGLLVTNADPVHASVTDGRALIGQITTCERAFQVCVSFQNGGVVTTSCTDGFVEVSDLCAPMIDPQVTVMEEIVLRRDRFLWCGAERPQSGVHQHGGIQPVRSHGSRAQLVSQQVEKPDFTGVPAGEYFVTLLDTARTVAFSSNTYGHHRQRCIRDSR